MQKHAKTAKVNIPMCCAAVLLCLTMLSIYLTSGLYARYTVTATGSDSARVMRWGNLTITETGDFYESNKLMIVPGVDLTKKVVVDFEASESAAYVFVELSFAKWQTEDARSFAIRSGEKVLMQWSVANDWTYLKNDAGTYVYYRTLEPNEELDSVDVIGDNGNIFVSEYITRSEIQTLTDVSIKLRATAVQADGSGDPVAIWNSVAAK